MTPDELAQAEAELDAFHVAQIRRFAPHSEVFARILAEIDATQGESDKTNAPPPAKAPDSNE